MPPDPTCLRNLVESANHLHHNFVSASADYPQRCVLIPWTFTGEPLLTWPVACPRDPVHDLAEAVAIADRLVVHAAALPDRQGTHLPAKAIGELFFFWGVNKDCSSGARPFPVIPTKSAVWVQLTCKALQQVSGWVPCHKDVRSRHVGAGWPNRLRPSDLRGCMAPG